MSKTIQSLRGMNDVLPADAALWEFFESAVRDWLHAYGYTQIRTPIVENTDLFVRSIGEVTDIVEKEMYSFEDKLNGEQITMRPEGTASCVRAAVQHNLLYNAPQRLWYMGPMFRHERPQKGRYRQFHQVGVESLGYAGPDMDAEHIIMTARLWKQLGLKNIELEINTLGSSEARDQYRSCLINYFEQHADLLDQDAQRRLYSNPLRILDSKNPAMQDMLEAAPRLMDMLDDASLKHFETLQEMLKLAKIDYRINPRLVRGLDYYNATVFEWVTTQLGAQGTVCAGGRYDGLVERIGGKPAPACGYAMGVERLLGLIQQAGEISGMVPDIYLVHAGITASPWAVQVAEQLRDGGCSVVLHCGGGSFKSQMKKADSSGARFAIIIGDDEVAAGEVMLKPLREGGEQCRMPMAKVINYLKI